jgi:AraC-like DNA-binding protein
MSVVFRLADEPARSRLDALRQVVEQTIVPLDIRPTIPVAELDDQLVMADLGVVRMTRNTISPTEILRTPRLIRSSDPEFCKIDVLLRGQIVIEQNDRQTLMRAGDLAFVDLSQPCRWVTQASEFVVMMFPRALVPLPYKLAGRLTGLAIPGGRGAGGLITSLVRQVAANPDDYGGLEGAYVGNAVLDLLSASLATRLDGVRLPPEAGQRALLLRIRAFIEQRLADPELSPATIAAAHHISVRYLHRLFETEEMTVAELIRMRRLERCSRDLLNPNLWDRPVSAIGARWGFNNAISFSRTFRTAYGTPPSEYRRIFNQTRVQ